MQPNEKLNAVNPSAKNPSARPLCVTHIVELTDQIVSLVNQYEKNERVLLTKTETQERRLHDWEEVVSIRNARIKRLVEQIDGKVTNWHRIRKWFLWFAAIGQAGFIYTQLV